MSPAPAAPAERVRHLLDLLGRSVRDRLIAARDEAGRDEAGRGDARRSVGDGLATHVATDEADAIYAIDRVSEDQIVEWCAINWPDDLPTRLVMEGAAPHLLGVLDAATTTPDVGWATLLIDPIDGTRMLMYDKRAAWFLAAWAPAPTDGRRPTLTDIEIAAMVELPPTAQWRSTRISAVRGGGCAGVRVEHDDLIRGGTIPGRATPSMVPTLDHSYATIAQYFPEAKELLARVEAAMFRRLGHLGTAAYPTVFHDQYASSGGQLAELVLGRDRFVADLRPLVLPHVGLPLSLCCHPYDICTALVLAEAGGVIERPDGSPLDDPLDTTSPITWAGYANPELAALIRPALQAALAEVLG